MDMEKQQEVRELDDQELAQASGAGAESGFVCKRCGCTSCTKIMKIMRGVNGRPVPVPMNQCNQCHDETLPTN